MQSKLIKIALIGKSNVGKSTFINAVTNEKISIVNKKINTTQDLITGIVNKNNSQLVFYDTPGSNYLINKNSKNNFKNLLWEAINLADCILYIIDSQKYKYDSTVNDLKKINETNKPIFVIFNKIDKIENKIIIPFIKDLNSLDFIDSFFNISCKSKIGIENLLNFLISKAYFKKWLYDKDIISDKDDIFISNECTRNSILKFVHQEIPYNLNVCNELFKKLDNKNIKIKQSIKITNIRYKPILLGKKGVTIKRIREFSQKEITKILKSKIHLYIQVLISND